MLSLIHAARATGALLCPCALYKVWTQLVPCVTPCTYHTGNFPSWILCTLRANTLVTSLARGIGHAGYSSAGRALPCQLIGRGLDPSLRLIN